jgi:hypothetical protein
VCQEFNSIYFLHIPKTAGTSIRALLDDNLPYSVVRKAVTFRALYSATRFIDRDIIRSTPYIHGHIPINISLHQISPVFRITFLRNPIDLSVSFFYYSKNLGLIDESFDLQSFIDSEYGLSLSNIQTRWLADSHVVTPNNKILETHEVDSKDYNNALENIANFDFIGFTTECEESCARLMDVLCFKSASSNQYNVGDYQKNLTTRERDSLTKINRADIELYDEVRSRMLKKRNKKIILTGELSPARYFETSFRLFFDFSYSRALTGFHAREIHPDFGSFRWSMAEGRVELDVVIRRNTLYKLKVCIVNSIDYDRIVELSLEINEQRVDFAIERDFSVLYLVGDFMSESDIGKPILIIKTPFANCPNVISSESTDGRELGVAVSWIYLGVSDSVINAETSNQSP